MRYYISDLHFSHTDLLYDKDCREFKTIEEMNTFMLNRWNTRVTDADEVIILGDFCNGSASEAERLLKQLKGRKCLLIGNHDRFLSDPGFDRSLFAWIAPYQEIYDAGRSVILSHYPVMFYKGQYRRDGAGKPKTWMLYGHLHDSEDEKMMNSYIMEMRSVIRLTRSAPEPEPIPCQMINCFCGFSDYLPLTLDEWIENDRARRRDMYKNTSDTESVYPVNP